MVVVVCYAKEAYTGKGGTEGVGRKAGGGSDADDCGESLEAGVAGYCGSREADGAGATGVWTVIDCDNTMGEKCEVFCASNVSHAI